MKPAGAAGLVIVATAAVSSCRGGTLPAPEMREARPPQMREARPEEVGFRPGGMASVDRVIEEAIAARAFPGGVVAVGKDSALVHLRPFGRFTYEPDATSVASDTIYDLASLTKVVVSTTMAMILVDEGRLDLSRPVSAYVPEFRGGRRDAVTVFHLLAHASGLPGIVEFFREATGREAILRRLLALELIYDPGVQSVYSDPGLMLLGEVLERVSGEPLDVFARRRIFEPLGMKDTLYRPGPELLPRIAPTEREPWRGRLVWGEVHDNNAFAMGGVAPHAGLFGTAPDLARFAQMMLDRGRHGAGRIVSPQAVERFTSRAAVPDSSRALGWDTPAADNSAGSRLSPRAFGHTGFTGTSMWIDPERRLFVILLSNRVYPTRENNAIRAVRRALADAVVEALERP